MPYPNALIQATPRNALLGRLSDALASTYSPERTQQAQQLAEFLSVPAISRTLDKLSYGEPLTTGAGGLGGTTRFNNDALEAAFAVAPMVGPAAKLAGKGAVATGRFVAPKAGQLAEGYMQRIGAMPGIVEQANPSSVWYRGQTGIKSGENPFESTIRGTPSFADSPAVASEYAMNPNAAENYGILGAKDVSGASVHPVNASGKVWNLNEFQGGHGTQTGITQDNLKKIAKEMGVDPSKLMDDLMESFSQKWGKGKNSYWDTTERGSTSKNRIIPAWVVAENEMLIEAAKNKGINAIQFKGALSDPNAYNSLLPWDESVIHQELRPFNKEAIKSTFDNTALTGAKFVAPQDEALRLAQQRASLPPAQGGLGLPAGNTPEQRAAAMGFDVNAYHGTNKDFLAFDKNKRGSATDQGWYGPGEYSSPFATGAEAYAMTDFPNYKESANIMPLLLRNPESITNQHGYVTEYVTREPDQIRSRFAAFDPWRKTAAIAATMGVAAPDLLAGQSPQQAPKFDNSALMK